LLYCQEILLSLSPPKYGLIFFSAVQEHPSAYTLAFGEARNEEDGEKTREELEYTQFAGHAERFYNKT
jgi:hypothetical protein